MHKFITTKCNVEQKKIEKKKKEIICERVGRKEGESGGEQESGDWDRGTGTSLGD